MHFKTVRSQRSLIHTTSKIKNKNLNLQKSGTNEQFVAEFVRG